MNPGDEVLIDYYSKWHCKSLMDQSLEGPILAWALEVVRRINVLRSIKVLTSGSLVIRYNLSCFIDLPLCQRIRQDAIT